MDLLDAIDKRFSCRSYKGKNVKEEDLRLVIEAAIKAPNAGNLQDFRFIVVKDEKRKEELSKAALDQKWMNEAPILIIICSDKKNIERFYKEKGRLYSIQDCAAAAENLMLTATSIGLASCWISAFNEEEVKRILRLPDNVEPYSIITLGYGNEEITERKRSSIDSFVHFEEYGNKEDTEVGLFPLGKHEEKLEKSSKGIFNKIKSKFKKN